MMDKPLRDMDNDQQIFCEECGEHDKLWLICNATDINGDPTDFTVKCFNCKHEWDTTRKELDKLDGILIGKSNNIYFGFDVEQMLDSIIDDEVIETFDTLVMKIKTRFEIDEEVIRITIADWMGKRNYKFDDGLVIKELGGDE